MATKSSLISSINSFLTAIVTITKHRNSMLEVVNELFQTTTIQTLVTGSDVFWHSLRYKKIGNIVYIDGYITNKFTTTEQYVNAVTIPNSLFFAKTGQATYLYGVNENTNTNVQFEINNDEIFLNTTLSPNQKVYINAHYQTND